MALRKKFLFLQLPSPPFLNVRRDWQGGFGTADSTLRLSYGQDFVDDIVVYLPLLRSAALAQRDGFDIHYLDAQIERLNPSQIIEEINKKKPSFIITPINLPSFYGDLRVLRRIKKSFPKIKIIAIGPVAKYLYPQLLETEIVDIALCLEPEAIISSLLSSIEKNTLFDLEGIAIRENHHFHYIPANLNWRKVKNLPYKIMYDLIPVTKYRNSLFGRKKKFMTIFSSKGCPYACRFYCPYPHFYGREVIMRPIQEVVGELTYLKQRFGIDNFIFRDQVFTYDRNRTIELCKEIKKKLRINWIVETRIEKIDPQVLSLMRQAGCVRIHVGIENPYPSLFSHYSKPGLKTNMMEEKLRELEKSGISYQTHLMVGFPEENWQTIQYTKSFLERFSIKHVQVSIATPYPGTAFRKLLLKLGLIICFNWSKYGGLYPVIRTKYLSARELLRAKYYLESNYENYYERKVRKIFFNLFNFTRALSKL